MLDKDVFDIEKLRISCKINLNFFKNKTCVKYPSVVPQSKKNENVEVDVGYMMQFRGCMPKAKII